MEKEDLKKTRIIIVLYTLLALALFCILPIIYSCSLGSSPFANFGQWASGLISVIGIPFLLYTLSLQTTAIKLQTNALILQADTHNTDKKSREEEEAEHTFELHCKSIEIGLSHLENIQGTFKGGAAIIRYGGLREAGSIEFNTITNELTVDALKSVVSALDGLLDWVRAPDKHFKFHGFFKIRFMSLIIGLTRMLPDGARDMTEDELFKTYANDNARYGLIIAIHRLNRKETDIWIEYIEEKKLNTPRA